MNNHNVNRREFLSAAATGIAATGLMGISLAESEASETSVEKTLESVLDQHQLIYFRPYLRAPFDAEGVKRFLMEHLKPGLASWAGFQMYRLSHGMTVPISYRAAFANDDKHGEAMLDWLLFTEPRMVYAKLSGWYKAISLDKDGLVRFVVREVA